jgi:hypothetical protein
MMPPITNQMTAVCLYLLAGRTAVLTFSFITLLSPGNELLLFF